MEEKAALSRFEKVISLCAFACRQYAQNTLHFLMHKVNHSNFSYQAARNVQPPLCKFERIADSLGWKGKELSLLMLHPLQSHESVSRTVSGSGVTQAVCASPAGVSFTSRASSLLADWSWLLLQSHSSKASWDKEVYKENAIQKCVQAYED